MLRRLALGVRVPARSGALGGVRLGAQGRQVELAGVEGVLVLAGHPLAGLGDRPAHGIDVARPGRPGRPRCRRAAPATSSRRRGAAGAGSPRSAPSASSKLPITRRDRDAATSCTKPPWSPVAPASSASRDQALGVVQPAQPPGAVGGLGRAGTPPSRASSPARGRAVRPPARSRGPPPLAVLVEDVGQVGVRAVQVVGGAETRLDLERLAQWAMPVRAVAERGDVHALRVERVRLGDPVAGRPGDLDRLLGELAATRPGRPSASAPARARRARSRARRWAARRASAPRRARTPRRPRRGARTSTDSGLSAARAIPAATGSESPISSSTRSPSAAARSTSPAR